MNVYKVSYFNLGKNQDVVVVANTAKKAVEDTIRYTKKKHYGEKEVVGIEKLYSVDVFYRS